jgi:membrane associated rhomboid family serine protease
MARSLSNAFLTPPHAIMVLLAIAEATIIILGAGTAGSGNIPVNVLLTNGALYDGAIASGEAYRFVTYGFLHANPVHLSIKLISLALLGPFLEARLRSANFLFI